MSNLRANSHEEYIKGLPANAGNPAYIIHLDVKDAIDTLNEMSMDKVEDPVEAASHIYTIVESLCDVIRCAGIVVSGAESEFYKDCTRLSTAAKTDARELLDAIHKGTIPLR